MGIVYRSACSHFVAVASFWAQDASFCSFWGLNIGVERWGAVRVIVNSTKKNDAPNSSLELYTCSGMAPDKKLLRVAQGSGLGFRVEVWGVLNDKGIIS